MHKKLHNVFPKAKLGEVVIVHEGKTYTLHELEIRGLRIAPILLSETNN